MGQNIDIIVPERDISKRVTALAGEIGFEYNRGTAQDTGLIIIGILTGVFIFLSDLVRQLHVPFELDFLGLNRYSSSDDTSGNIRLFLEPRISLEGKRVLLIDGILDKGITLGYAVHYARMYSPLDIKTCVLLSKDTPREYDITPDFTGFAIPDTYVFGYGMDSRGRYRNLPYIGRYRD